MKRKAGKTTHLIKNTKIDSPNMSAEREQIIQRVLNSGLSEKHKQLLLDKISHMSNEDIVQMQEETARRLGIENTLKDSRRTRIEKSIRRSYTATKNVLQKFGLTPAEAAVLTVASWGFSRARDYLMIAGMHKGNSTMIKAGWAAWIAAYVVPIGYTGAKMGIRKYRARRERRKLLRPKK